MNDNPECDYVEIYIDSRTGIENDFGTNFKIIILNIIKENKIIKSTKHFGMDVIYQIKERFMK